MYTLRFIGKARCIFRPPRRSLKVTHFVVVVGDNVYTSKILNGSVIRERIDLNFGKRTLGMYTQKSFGLDF